MEYGIYPFRNYFNDNYKVKTEDFYGPEKKKSHEEVTEVGDEAPPPPAAAKSAPSQGVSQGGAGDAKGQRKRKDGTRNKMSFDVDELEEGLYVEVEDEEDVEEVVEYEEVPDDEADKPAEPAGELTTC